MKFTKEDAFERLKGILTNDGKKPLRMSEISINRNLDALIPIIANDEMEIDDFIEKVKAIFETSNSNVEHDASTRLKEELDAERQKWEKEMQDKHKPNPKDDDKDKDMQSLIDKISALEGKFAEQDKMVKIADIKKQLKNEIKKKGVDNDDWLNSVLGLMSIDESTDITQTSDNILKIYNKQQSEITPNISPLSPTSGHEKDPFAKLKGEIKRQEENNKNIV